MTTHRRLIAVALSVAFTVAGCGGDDDADQPAIPAGSVSSTPDTTPDTMPDTTADAGGAPADGPTPTIDPDVPEQFLAGIGPIAVTGDPLPALPDGGDDPAVGTAAPTIVGADFAGRPVQVDASVDGPTWLIFLAHWCPHCNDEIPVINTLRDDGRIPDGVRVVAVSTAVAPDRPNFPPGQWLQDKDWTFDVVADGIDTKQESFIAAGAFGVSGFPFSVLVDADGDVVRRWSGERDPDDIVSMLSNDLALG